MNLSESNTTTSQKRKKESVPRIMVSAFEFSNPTFTKLLQHSPIGISVFHYVRCLSRVQATLKLGLSDACSSVEWYFRISASDVSGILEICYAGGLLATDETHIWCPEVVDDVRQYDERRQQLSEAGKRGVKARLNHPSTPSQSTLKHPRKGKERLGKVRKGRERVLIENEDRTRLLTEMSEPELTYWVSKCTEYAKAKPRKWAQYSDHPAVIRNWRSRRIEDGFRWDPTEKIYSKPGFQNGGFKTSGEMKREKTEKFLKDLAEGRVEE